MDMVEYKLDSDAQAKAGRARLYLANARRLGHDKCQRERAMVKQLYHETVVRQRVNRLGY